MMKTLILCTALLFLGQTATAYESVHDLELSADKIENLIADIGDPVLTIRSSDSDQIKIRLSVEFEGWSEAEARRFLDKGLIFKLEQAGSNALLASRVEYHGPDFIFSVKRFFKSIVGKKRKYPLSRLEIAVPENINLRIDDESQSVDIAGIKGNININHAVGPLTLKAVNGSAAITVGSGVTEISGVNGDLSINQGGGELTINDVSGDANINDGSGRVKISGIKGRLSIIDGSGDIDVADVGSDLLVFTDGRGSIRASNVRGETQMKIKRAEPIFLSNMYGVTHITDSVSNKVETINAGDDVILRRHNRVLAIATPVKS